MSNTHKTLLFLRDECESIQTKVNIVIAEREWFNETNEPLYEQDRITVTNIKDQLETMRKEAEDILKQSL